ncbi:MAG: helix-turn-helix domain-containing protein, partial [Aristaeellaceae bacterium]
MAVLPCRCYINTDVSGRELATHGTLSFPIACYFADAGFEPVPPHWHNEFELILVTQGEMNVQAQMTQYCLGAGMGIFVNANILHAASQCSMKTCFHSLVFSPSLIGGAEQSVFWTRYLSPLVGDLTLPYLVLSPDCAWQKRLLELAEAAWQEAAGEQPGYEFRLRADLSECIFLLSQNAAHRDSPDGRKRFAREQRLKTMLTFINTHYSEEITLSDIAASASVSTTECLRCFRDGVQLSPIQYMKRYRLIIASKYLKTTDWPVGEIGSRCGFQEMGYFAAQFKKQFGVTPT